MIGTLTEADSQRIILGNDMADAVTYGTSRRRDNGQDAVRRDEERFLPGRAAGRRDGADGRMGGAGQAMEQAGRWAATRSCR
ncbi:MAG: hypothetical protein ACLUI3_05675 [Christensenellales bacterium]